MIGKLTRVPLREVWKHEAYDLTKWLSQNPDVLSEAIGITITNVESEHPIGTFNADLIGEDDNGDHVVIENQYGKSDHDHLGKLITYASELGAKIAIWIVEDARPEHIQSVTWLNQAGFCSFYVLKIEAVKILPAEAPNELHDRASEPAPLLTLITGPSDELVESGRKKKELVEREILRKEFWAGLLEKLNSQTNLYSNVSPSQFSNLWTGSGKAGVGFNFRISKNAGAVELYFGTSDANINSQLLDILKTRKDSIETEFGGKLEWDEMEGQKASRLRHDISKGGYRNAREEWPTIQTQMADAMLRLEQAVRPYMADL